MAKDIAIKKEAPRELVTVTGSRGIVPVMPEAIEVYDDMGSGIESTGLEHVTAKERRIPILRPLDPKAPQCNPPENGGIPGATGGTIFNTSTSEIYDRKLGLYIVPFLTDLKYVRYIKKNEDGSGGGLLGILESNDPTVLQRQKERMAEHGNLYGKLPDGTTEDGKEIELVETHYLYGIMIRPNDDGSYPGQYGSYFPAAIPFSSTQIKQHAAFIERCMNMRYNLKQPSGPPKSFEVAMWSHVWHLKPFLEKRGQQTWWGWRMTLGAKDKDGVELPYPESRLSRNSPLFIEAEDLRATVLEGNAQVEFDKDRGEGDGTAGNVGHGSSSGADADIPM